MSILFPCLEKEVFVLLPIKANSRIESIQMKLVVYTTNGEVVIFLD